MKTITEGNGYTASDITNNNSWHSITYTVSKSNFNRDGIYTVTVYSEDKATNKQSNQSKDAEIKFLLDTTAPSVIVSGLEDSGVYQEDSHDFTVNASIFTMKTVMPFAVGIVVAFGAEAGMLFFRKKKKM